MTVVNSLGGNYGLANDINEAGHIVGISANANGVTHAFVNAFGNTIDLGSFQPSTYNYSIAYGINNVGSVAGYSTHTQTFSEAFLHSGGTLQNLGNLGGSSRGFAVNNSNQVTGDSIIDASGNQRAFIWENGTMNDLGVIGGAVSSLGLDINNLGHVVGTLVFDLNNGNLNHGFVYRDGLMVDLNTLLPENSGWVLRGAWAINDRGQIVGGGEIGGEQRAYLLTSIPEPSTIAQFGVILLLVSARRRQRIMR
jgi:probable HAF family extracellular repeat protein